MISELAKRLSQELQQALPLLGNLIPKREMQATLQSVLARLDLVTRDEFDAQAAVLQRTRMKLEALEQRCAQLENYSSQDDTNKPEVFENK
ncbi:MAG: accessory factor UbiK family protein [Pseudomonadota bacterium]